MTDIEKIALLKQMISNFYGGIADGEGAYSAILCAISTVVEFTEKAEGENE